MLVRLIEGEALSLNTLAEGLSLSDRMARRMVGALNEELSSQYLPTIGIGSEGILSFEYEYDDLVEDIQAYLDSCTYYSYRLSPAERKTLLTIMLLRDDSYLTAQACSEYLETSRNTILSDFALLKVWFEVNGLELSSKVQKGYRVVGSEQAIRSALAKVVGRNLDYKSAGQGSFRFVFQRLLLQEIGYAERYRTIARIIRSAEREFNLHFSDFSFIEVAIELLILCERLSRGCTLGDGERQNPARVRSSKYPMSSRLLDAVGMQFGMRIPEDEKLFFVQVLRGQSYLKADTLTLNMEEGAIQIIVAEIVAKITRKLLLVPFLEFSLYDILVDHFKSAIHRATSNSEIVYPFLDDVVRKYPEIFALVKENMGSLEQYLGTPISDDEIGFIATYFAALYEQQRTELRAQQKVQVSLRIGQGRGNAQLFESQLLPLSDLIEVVSVDSVLKEGYGGEVPPSCDLVIADAPCDTHGIPLIITKSIVLSQEDIGEIRERAMAILDARVIPNTAHSSRVGSPHPEGAALSQDCICLDYEASTWQDAVLAGGRLLCDAGKVESGYPQAMVDAIETFGPYVVILEGLAIPHADAERGATSNALSLIRLKEPVAFGSDAYDPVRWVACMSLLSSKAANATIFNLTRIFMDEGLVERLNGAEDAAEVHALLNGKL